MALHNKRLGCCAAEYLLWRDTHSAACDSFGTMYGRGHHFIRAAGPRVLRWLPCLSLPTALVYPAAWCLLIVVGLIPRLWA